MIYLGKAESSTLTLGSGLENKEKKAQRMMGWKYGEAFRAAEYMYIWKGWGGGGLGFNMDHRSVRGGGRGAGENNTVPDIDSDIW